MIPDGFEIWKASYKEIVPLCGLLQYRIENLIVEQNRQNDYEKSLNELNIKVNAISSSIEELEAKEKIQSINGIKLFNTE